MRIGRLVAGVLAVVLIAVGGAGASPRDTDGDGMPDSWEVRHRLNPADPSDASKDPDRDRLNNLLEYRHGGDPHDRDTDSDGLRDGAEVFRWHSLVDVANQVVGRVRVTGRCAQSTNRKPCRIRSLFAVTVIVREPSGDEVDRTTTSSNGRFAFDHLSPGRYELDAMAVAGATAPAPLDALIRRGSSASVATFFFADSNSAGVVGQATQAPTCGGPQSPGEDCVAPLGGATISVHQGDEGGPVVASATTGADGYYAFRLDPGAYTLVAEATEDSQWPTPPAPASFTVSPDDNGPHLVDSPYDTGIR